MTTGWLCHELYFWHNTWNWSLIFPPSLTIQPGTHSENPETRRRFRNLVEVSGLINHLVDIKPRSATPDEIARVHTREHIAKIEAMSGAGGGDAGHLTPLGAGSYEIALLAAGGAIVAAEAVVSGDVENAYALVRPPGHHALPDCAMGFCLFSNAAIAIRHLQANYGIERVATVDWDVHHGNGMQAIFYEDPSILTISLHQENLFPANSGSLIENGAGLGFGFNINVPLPPGSGIGAYAAAFERVVIPALRRFKPELITVLSGFDASGVDPLGRMMMSSGGYRQLTRMLVAVARELCGGRVLMVHEGGYSEMYVPFCGLAVIEQLSGISTDVKDPWEPAMLAWGRQELQPHQAAAIDAAEALISRIS